MPIHDTHFHPNRHGSSENTRAAIDKTRKAVIIPFLRQASMIIEKISIRHEVIAVSKGPQFAYP